MENLGLVNMQHDQAVREIYENSIPMIFDNDGAMAGPTRELIKDNNVLQMLYEQPLWMMPNLLSAMVAEEPPSIELFLSLPSAIDLDKSVLEGCWIVYVRCYYDEQTKSWKVYIGSAASIHFGSLNRMKDYRMNSYTKMSSNIKKALDQGYKRVHLGVLVLHECEVAIRIPQRRALILALETDFTYRFWAVHRGMKSDPNDHYMRLMCPWDPKDFTYTGLGSHSPLMDSIRELPPGLPIMTAMDREKQARLHNHAIQRGELRLEDLSVHEQYAVSKVQAGNAAHKARYDAGQGEEAKSARYVYKKMRLGEIPMVTEEEDPEVYKLQQDGIRRYEKGKRSSANRKAKMLALEDAEDTTVLDENDNMGTKHLTARKNGRGSGLQSLTETDEARQRRYHNTNTRHRHAVALLSQFEDGDTTIDPTEKNTEGLLRAARKAKAAATATSNKERDAINMLKAFEAGDPDVHPEDPNVQKQIELGRHVRERRKRNHVKEEQRKKQKFSK